MSFTLPGPFNVALPLADILEHVQPTKLSGPVFTLLGKPVYFTNHHVMMLLAALLMLIIFPVIGAQSKKNPVPTGFRNFFEAIMSFLRTEVFQPALGENTDRFAPFLWTVFFFILFCNLLGLIPFREIIELINGTAHTRLPAFGGTATGNIAVTGALAVAAFIFYHIAGIAQQVRFQMDPSLGPHHTGHDHLPPHGHGGTFGAEGLENGDVKSDHHVGDGHDHAHGLHHAPAGKAFPVALVTGILHYFKNFVPPVPFWLWPVMFVLELIGALIKPFSLAVRLFANMIAGHLVLAALIGMIFLASNLVGRSGISIPVIIGCAALSLLELFVAFLQTYIFTFLTTLFLASAVAPEH